MSGFGCRLLRGRPALSRPSPPILPAHPVAGLAVLIPQELSAGVRVPVGEAWAGELGAGDVLAPPCDREAEALLGRGFRVRSVWCLPEQARQSGGTRWREGVWHVVRMRLQNSG